MKKSLLAVLMTLMLFSANQLFAQTPLKVGYTNVEVIISALPDAKTIEAELKTYETQLSNQLQSMEKEFKTKYADYNTNKANWPQITVEAKERELQAADQNIQEFQEKASVDLQQKQQALLKPVYDKVQKAIDEVAKTEGYTHIFSAYASGLPVLLYAGDEYNITNKVITKLGGTVPAK